MSDNPPVDDQITPSRPSRRELAWVLVVVLLIGITRFPTLDNKLLEAGHAQRQTQTAIQTVVFHEDGIDLLRPEIPVLGHPWAVPLEFPLLQAIASVPMSWGIPSDVANRTTGLAFFALTAVLLWLLVREIGGARVAAVTLVVFAFSPFSLLWSRASMIEYLATAGAVGWALAILRWMGRPTRLVVIAGVVVGSIAMTVKPTTALPWLMVPVFAHFPDSAGSGLKVWLRRRLRPAMVGMVVVPLVAGLAWVAHADEVKAESPVTAALTSEALREWQTGTLAQRLDGGNIATILERIDAWIVGYGMVAVIIAVLVVARRRAWLGMAVVPLVAIGVFFNLYVVHDYYLAAVSPALAALLAMVLVATSDRLFPGDSRITVGLTSGWLAVALLLSHSYWLQAYEGPRGAPPESVEIAALTDPGDLVMVGGIDWDPRVLYYAERRGLMLYEPFVTREFAASLPDLDRYRALYLAGPLSHLAEWAAIRPWFAPVSEHTLLLADDLEGLGEVDLAATVLRFDEIGITETGRSLEGFAETTVTCNSDERLLLPGGIGDLWISVRSNGEARVQMNELSVPVSSEAQTLVWRDTGLGRGAAEVTCINAGSVTFQRALVEVPGAGEGI